MVKRRSLSNSRKNILKSFNKLVHKNNKRKIIIGTIIVSLLSISCVGYFQGKNVFASNNGVFKSLEISKKAEQINNITAYEKLEKGEEIKVLFLGDESYIGNNILKEDIKKFVKDTYNSNISLTDLSKNGVSIYEQLNEYTNLENREFDLVFLCFENSDEGEVSKTNFSGIYETIIRDLKYNNASVDIIPVIKHKTLVSDTYYQIINNISKYYDLQLAKVNEEILNNNVQGEGIEDFKNSYYSVLSNIISNNIESKKEINTEYKDIYYGVTTLFEPYKVTIKPEKKKGFSFSQNQVKSANKDDYIRYKIEGNTVGLAYKTSENGGIIEIYINRTLYRRIDTKSDKEETKYVLISSDLTENNEVKVVNSNGGDVTLLGVITSGNNKDSSEVESLNKVLARNKGDYNGQTKNDSLYEGAKKDSKEEVVVSQQSNKKETVKSYKNNSNKRKSSTTNKTPIKEEVSVDHDNSTNLSGNVSENHNNRNNNPGENIDHNLDNNQAGAIDNPANNQENSQEGVVNNPINNEAQNQGSNSVNSANNQVPNGGDNINTLPNNQMHNEGSGIDNSMNNQIQHESSSINNSVEANNLVDN